MEYSRSMNKIGLILYGSAILYCCDEEGNEYMIDELKKDAVFGEPFLLPADSQHYYVTAEEETKVMFIDYDHVIKRCEKACHHHSQMVSNLLQMTAMQSRQQMERIYVLSRTTTRKKLLAYLNNLSSQTHSHSVQIPMSYTALAQYLTVDRSAMTRELKNLEKEGRVQILLQKRSQNKDSFPGKFDTSSAGHIQAGDEPLESALRELKEELGISAVPEQLHFAGTFPISFAKEFHEKMFRDEEIAFVYIFNEPVNTDELILQTEEVESVQWFDLEEVCEKCEKHRDIFCVPTGGLEVVRKYLDTVKTA